jgi:dCTP deaminase
MLLNDAQIKARSAQGMITPFEDELISRIELPYSSAYPSLPFMERRCISYGLSSFGYDIRLSPKDFRTFRHIPGTILNPKRFNPENLEPAQLHIDDDGSYFILPGHSYGLGVALEHLSVPDNITVLCIGKSTYCRCGIIANLSPAEASWRGHLTLEFSNASPADARIYANEGVVQLLFLEGDACEVSYEKRQGKYQDQPESVTLARQ